jgi:hypothetical protein
MGRYGVVSWLSDTEIAAMASTIAGAVLSDTCNIYNQVLTPDGAGGNTPELVLVSGGSAVPCRRRPIRSRGQLEVVGGAEGVAYDYVFTFGTAAPIATNRIIIHNNQTFQIRQISDSPSWLLARRADVTVVE